ncbi:translocation/assembly module TamB domain-containing protein [Bordetella sp. 02P26C-1]|uniref:translocation/assembly module TamB domain-containing protein n=1 Tax=Bordetella sp. 02P26C-1 TaxID=2683195 RepID=UPI001353D295|nr:translocation/assembly module TamB domain-containing protein [Bordetella sp. 02P26C-1]MVW78002.1 hypothetical protein [Bordetella sp. 02P26C-1]
MKWLRGLLRLLFVWGFPLLLTLFIALCGLALWLTGTQTGTRTLLKVVAQQFDGVVEDVNGSILGGLEVGRLQIVPPGAAVDLTDLRLRVRWRALQDYQLHVEELSAATLRVDVVTSDDDAEQDANEPVVVPELPLTVAVDRFAVGDLAVTLNGEPLPVAVSDLAAQLSTQKDGAQLVVNSLRVAHEQIQANLDGRVDLRQLSEPWPLQASLNIAAQSTGVDSPLCATRALHLPPADALAKGKTSQAGRAKNDGKAGKPAAAAKKAGKQTKDAKESHTAAEAAKPPSQPTAASAVVCAATARIQAEGSLSEMTVRLDGATADGALKLAAQAGLALEQAFPLRTANLDLRLADDSGATITLDRQPLPDSVGVDRLVATLDARRLNLGALAGDALPPGLLSARMALEAQLVDVFTLRQADVQLQIDKDSRWNRQPLFGTLKGRVDVPATGAQAAASATSPSITPGSTPAVKAPTPSDDPLAGFKLHDLVLDLTLGPNRVKAQGELIEGAGALTLDAQAPRLDAFWPDLPGGATLKGKLAGRLDQHKGELSARYTPADSRADTLGRAPMQADVAFTGGWGAPVVRARQDEAVSAAPDATQRPDDAKAAAGATTSADLRAALTGWRGKIDRLTASSMNFSASLQPVTLAFLPDAQTPQWQWEVAATQLTLTLPNKQRAVIAHQGSRGGQGRWQTAGRADNLEINSAMLREIMRALDPAAAEAQRQNRVNARGSQASRRIALDAAWDLQFAGALSGTARIARRDGDLRIPGDPPIPLGLTRLVVDVKATPTGGGASRLDASLDVRTQKMGVMSGTATAVLLADAHGGFSLDEKRPIRADLNANIDDLTWVDLFVGDTMEIRGKLQANVSAQGTLNGKWATSGTVRGRDLRVVRIDDGVRLIDGTLDAHLDGTRVVLDSLRFPASLRVMPDEWRTREWITQNPDAKGGYAEATGWWDIETSQGAIRLKLYRFPALQRSDRYAMVSGTINLDAQLPRLSITGDLTADAGWFSLEILQGVPTLDDDVHVIRPGDSQTTRSSPLQITMDLKFDMGPRFYITGMGLDAGLVGSLQIHMADGRLTGIGALRTRAGGIEAYGQKLRLRRGTLTFQGRLDNPILDIEALRTGEQVEAGVRVTGTAQRPRIDLVSYPDVSDVEKLSWLILGRGPDENGNDAALLLSVGTALLGGGQPFYKQFGLDDVSIRSGNIGSSGSLLPDRTVASQVNSGSDSDLATQFLVASKRFANGITLSLEQAMAGSETVGRASYQLSRHWSVDLKGGAVNGIALVYKTFFAD